MERQPNPYLLSIFTALLSGAIAITGFYLTAKFQSEAQMKHTRYELKSKSYMDFLESLNRETSPVVAEILNIGNVSEHVMADSEIQALEDSFGRLAKLNSEYGLSWQISSDFGVLRLNGSDLVRQYCSDILAVLALKEFSVDWNKYPVELQELRTKWITAQKGVNYGWVPRVSPDERVMFVLISAMYENLVNELRKELNGEDT